MADLSKYKKAAPQQAKQMDLSRYKKAATISAPSFTATPKPLITGPSGKGFLGAIGKGITDFGVGVGSSIGKAGFGLGELAAKGVGQIAGVTAGAEGKRTWGDIAGNIRGLSQALYDQPQFTAARKSVPGTIGTAVGTAAPYFIPGGAATKAEKIISSSTKALPKALGVPARIIGKGLAQGVPAAAVDYATTGGDAKSAVTTGLTAGALRGGMAAGGEVARGFNFPERLYTTVFKNSKPDMLKELRSNGVEALKTSDPDLFDQLVQSGAIRTTKTGATVVNETLAEQALNRGIRGSLTTMSNAVVKGTLKSEAAAKEVAGSYKGTVDLPEEQFQKVLKGIAQDYEDVGFGEISKQADELANTLKSNDGKVSALDALQIRRFLDKMRVKASYNPNTKLSLSQDNLKTLTDTVRSRVNAIPEMSGVMKDYSFYIDALEALAKEATRRGNNQVVSLIDSILFGGAAATGAALPATIGVARRVLMSPAGATQIGTALTKGSISPIAGGALGAASSLVPSD